MEERQHCSSRYRRMVVILLLLQLVSLANGSTVASVEPRLLGIIPIEELDDWEEQVANVSSVDIHNQKASTVGYQEKEEFETTTLSTPNTTSQRDLRSDTATMDLITIIWYVATLIALISFFVVMACTDTNKCITPKPEDIEAPVPPTPAPSYRLFAPPSYDSVIDKESDSIFVIPIPDSRGQFSEDLVTNLPDVMQPEESSSNTERNIERQLSITV